ncbi:MAG TPA: head completion/stabilization protein [Candidatus Sulfotelmatobacter sp.]|jgi:hypothetical protein|nr:head completion/stabilization protein [Candidatus Sulfotelmatobacter sp.]
MMTLIPSTPTGDDDDTMIRNDGWYPDLDAAAFKLQTGQGDVFASERIGAVLQSAMIEVNASIMPWRLTQTADSLAGVPAPLYGDVSEKVILYTDAVFNRARSALLRNTRDYDSTKDGHNRADKLESVADDFLRQSSEALARLTGRPRMVVELI